MSPIHFEGVRVLALQLTPPPPLPLSNLLQLSTGVLLLTVLHMCPLLGAPFVLTRPTAAWSAPCARRTSWATRSTWCRMHARLSGDRLHDAMANWHPILLCCLLVFLLRINRCPPFASRSFPVCSSSEEAHNAAVQFTFPMFSMPALHSDIISKLS